MGKWTDAWRLPRCYLGNISRDAMYYLLVGLHSISRRFVHFVHGNLTCVVLIPIPPCAFLSLSPPPLAWEIKVFSRKVAKRNRPTFGQGKSNCPLGQSGAWLVGQAKKSPPVLIVSVTTYEGRNRSGEGKEIGSFGTNYIACLPIFFHGGKYRPDQYCRPERYL